MKINTGKLDRSVRLVAGIGLVAGGFFTAGWAAIVLWALGAVMLLVAAVGVCPLYMPFNINTAGKDAKKK